MMLLSEKSLFPIDVSFPVQKRGSFSFSSLLITWNFGDWDLQLQQERMGIPFHFLKTQIICCTSKQRVLRTLFAAVSPLVEVG